MDSSRYFDSGSRLEFLGASQGVHELSFNTFSPDPYDSFRITVTSGSVSFWHPSYSSDWQTINGDVDFYNTGGNPEQLMLRVDGPDANFHFSTHDSYSYYPYDDAPTDPSAQVTLISGGLQFDMGQDYQSAWNIGELDDRSTFSWDNSVVSKSNQLTITETIGGDDFSDYAKFELDEASYISLNTSGALVEIVNAQGQVVLSSDDAYYSQVDGNLNKGIYYLHFSSESSELQEFTADLTIEDTRRPIRPTPTPFAASAFPTEEPMAFDSRYFESGEKVYVLGAPQGIHELTYTLFSDDPSDLFKVWEVSGDISYLDGDRWVPIHKSATFANTGGVPQSLTFRIDSEIGSLKLGTVDLNDLSNPSAEVALYSQGLSFDMGNDMMSAWNVFTLRPDYARSWDAGVVSYTDKTYIHDTIGGNDQVDFARFRLTEDSTIRLTATNAIAQIINAQGQVVLDSGDSYMTYFQYELAAGEYFIRFYSDWFELQEFNASLELVSA